MKNKEAFAVGTLLSAIVWFFLSLLDFRYLSENISIYFYVFIELMFFLLTGFYLMPVTGLVVYITTTIFTCAVLMNQTFRELITYGKSLLTKFKTGGM